MTEHQHKHRVVYSETDVMGYLHHSNYARLYENARWELFRELGIPYSKLEDDGYMLPVIGMTFKFVKSAQYDDLLTIKTKIKEIIGPRITFSYRTFNQNDELVNKAEVNLAFIEKSTREACFPPNYILEAIEKESSE